MEGCITRTKQYARMSEWLELSGKPNKTTFQVLAKFFLSHVQPTSMHTIDLILALMVYIKKWGLDADMVEEVQVSRGIMVGACLKSVANWKANEKTRSQWWAEHCCVGSRVVSSFWLT